MAYVCALLSWKRDMLSCKRDMQPGSKVDPGHHIERVQELGKTFGFWLASGMSAV